MKAPFAVGEAVICVRGGMALLEGAMVKLVNGFIYFIKRSGPKNPQTTGPWCRIVGFADTNGRRDGLDANRFRPLNPDDYEALRQKHGIPTPATVKTE